MRRSGRARSPERDPGASRLSRSRRTLALAALFLAALAGCGEDERGTPPQRLAEPAGGPQIVIAALGDSITAGTPGYEPDPDAPAAAGRGDPRSTYEHWAALSDRRLRFRNCGVPGERTDQIAERLEACAAGAEVLVVQGGINDVAQSLAGPVAARFAAVDDAARNLREMVRRGKQLGLEVELVDLLPWNNGHPYATPLLDELNRRIEQTATEEGVPVLPFHDVLEDPELPGLMKPEWTAEGDHPSVEGYRRLGELAFRLP